MRKMKLMEEDLDTSEDKAQDATAKLRDTEGALEEAQRENKQLLHRIDRLEGESSWSEIIGSACQMYIEIHVLDNCCFVELKHCRPLRRLEVLWHPS